uniref:Uncharacterized protein n=1 Tax=Moniliophthora roreri TaxID=221103 RepID=A0A0W0FD73_MONRR
MEGKTAITHTSTTDADSPALPPFLLLPFVTFLIASGVAIFKWRFPCSSTKGLERESARIHELIMSAWEEDLLGDSETQFKRAWRKYRDEIEDIKLRAIRKPDSRTHPVAWILFYLHQLRVIDACYTGLRVLTTSIKWQIEMEKKKRRFGYLSDAYSSGVSVPDSESFRSRGTTEVLE